MKTFATFLEESKINFTNWKKLTPEQIALEYKVEYQIKPLAKTGWFPTLKDFQKAINSATVISLTPSVDRKIANRSHTKSKEQIISLIKGYASYPEFRNEKTIEAIYDGFKNNSAMTYPLVLKLPDGSMRIFAGNTRADIAVQLGIVPKALLIEVPSKE